MADEATRQFDGLRPVPTGNTLLNARPLEKIVVGGEQRIEAQPEDILGSAPIWEHNWGIAKTCKGKPEK